jgi:hypothetical protein
VGVERQIISQTPGTPYNLGVALARKDAIKGSYAIAENTQHLLDKVQQNEEELFMIKESKMESPISIDQTKTNDISEPKTLLQPSKKGVFLMRAEGQSFEEFKKACIDSFRKAGLLKD